MSRVVESVSLHYTDNATSDKIYNIELTESGNGLYEVTGYNGRRGGTLTPQLKTASPVTYAQAKKIFDDLERDKLNHRRTPYRVIGRNGQNSGAGTGSTTPGATSPAGTKVFDATGYVAKHPKRITRDEAVRLLEDAAYIGEQKADGLFLSILYQTGRVTASNKLGKGIPVPPQLAAAMRELAAAAGCEISLGLAGEYLDGALHVFDVWQKNSVQLESLPYHLRVAMKDKLEITYHNHLIATGQSGEAAIRFIYTAKTTEEKRALYEKLLANDAEGVIFKHREDPSVFAKKVKFWETADCIVVANIRRSAECFVYHQGVLTSVGSVTCPTPAIHKEIREANERGEKKIASVRYLYLSAPVSNNGNGIKGGQFIQPCFLRFREDIDDKSCTSEDLKVTNKAVLELPAAPDKDVPETHAATIEPKATLTNPDEGKKREKTRRRKLCQTDASQEPEVISSSQRNQAAISEPGSSYIPTLFIL